MSYPQISSFDQVPQGINLLFAELTEIKNWMRNQPAQQGNNDESYLTRQQAAEILQVSLPTLNELTKNKKVASYRLGGKQIRYKLSEIEAALVANL